MTSYSGLTFHETLQSKRLAHGLTHSVPVIPWKQLKESFPEKYTRKSDPEVKAPPVHRPSKMTQIASLKPLTTEELQSVKEIEDYLSMKDIFEDGYKPPTQK